MPPKVVPKSNVALLTEGQSYIKRAKRARQDQVEEVKFDDEARREWLTGFSKRKKQRVEGRRERAKERDKLAHLEEVKEARRELKERALQNVKDVRRAMGLSDLPEPGAEAETEVAEPEQDEYEDEETQATVTIQEDFDPSSAPVVKVTEEASSSATVPTLPPIFELPASSRKQQLKAVREKDKAKTKKKKDATGSFETKAERKKGRALETLRRNEKGALARERTGGSSRGRGGSRGGRGGSRGGSRGGRGGGRGGKK